MRKTEVLLKTIVFGRTNNKRRRQRQNCATNHGQHITQRKTTTSLARTCFAYGPRAHTRAVTVVAGTRIQEKTRSTQWWDQGTNSQGQGQGI